MSTRARNATTAIGSRAAPATSAATCAAPVQAAGERTEQARRFRRHGRILGWEVANIQDVAATLARRGVVFTRYAWFEQDDLGIWTAPGGARVAWFKDPGGNVLSISQAAEPRAADG